MSRSEPSVRLQTWATPSIASASNMKHLLFILIVVSVPVSYSLAQPMGTDVPHTQGIEMGEIEGTLFTLDKKGKKTPLSGNKVAIIVFRNGQRILMLDKTTDQKGVFTFKNIFKDPSYSYALGALFEDIPYLFSPIQLSEKEDKKVVSFQVGAGSPYKMEGMPDQGQGPQRTESRPSNTVNFMAPPSGSVEPHRTVPSVLSHPYQRIALSLSILVLILAWYLYTSTRKKPVSNAGKEKLLISLAQLRDFDKKGKIPKEDFEQQEKRLLGLLRKFY